MTGYRTVTFRTRRRITFIPLTVGLLALASCGGSSSQSGAKLVQRQGTSSSSSSSTTTSTTTPSQFKVGDTVKTAHGNTETVYTYSQPVQPSNSYLHPDAGKEYASADVQACATGDLTQDQGRPVPQDQQYIDVNPFDYVLIMPDNTRLQPSIGAKDPALNDTKIYKGDCVRGWITWQVPAGQRPSFITDTKTQPLIKFQV